MKGTLRPMPSTDPGAPEAWIFLESSRGRIARNSVEALSAGIGLQRQYRYRLAALFARETLDDSEIHRLGSYGVERVVALEGVGTVAGETARAVLERWKQERIWDPASQEEG